MKRLKIWTLLTLLTIFSAAACTATTSPEATAVPPDPTPDNTIRLTPITTPAVDAVPPTNATPVVGEVPAEIMTAAFDQLNNITGLAREAVTVVQAEAVVWSDGSLGCPQPGEVYTQALVDGYLIVLEADGRLYNFHAADTGFVFLCENTLPQPPAAGTPSS